MEPTNRPTNEAAGPTGGGPTGGGQERGKDPEVQERAPKAKLRISRIQSGPDAGRGLVEISVYDRGGGKHMIVGMAEDDHAIDQLEEAWVGAKEVLKN